MSFRNLVAHLCVYFLQEKPVMNFNMQMLSYLPFEVNELVCTDEVDETAGAHKWNKKAAKQLEKLNSDCNRTAGLEAKLSLAVGARVMLHRNINTKHGLVNGAIGTVTSIAPNHVTVQFDHVLSAVKPGSVFFGRICTSVRMPLRAAPCLSNYLTA